MTNPAGNVANGRGPHGDGPPGLGGGNNNRDGDQGLGFDAGAGGAGRGNAGGGVGFHVNFVGTAPASPWVGGTGGDGSRFVPPVGSPVTGAVNTPIAGPAGAPGQHPNQLQPPRFQGHPNPLPPQGTGGQALPGTAPPNALPPTGIPGQPARGVPGQGAVPQVSNGLNAVTLAPPRGLAQAGAQSGWVGPVAPAATGLAQGPGAHVPLARQPAHVAAALPAQGLANPRADAAAAAMQGRAQVNVTSPHPVAAQAAAVVVPAGLAAKPAQPALANAPVAMQAHANAGRAAPGGQGSAQAVMQAQAALALALGKVAAGQTTAGTGAMALAEAQLALRASKLALTQAQLAAQAPRTGAAAPAAAANLAAARPQVFAGTLPRAGAAVPVGPSAMGAGPQAARAGAQAQAGGAAREPTQATQLAPAAMPRALAAALAMAPKLRKRGTYDRVEAVDRDTPRQQAPEMEDEDFWAESGNEGDWDEAPAGMEDALDHAEAQRQAAAQAAAQHYRAVRAWLVANDQQALLHELAAGRRVLVWAPPDKTRLRLLGHLLRPDAPSVGAGAGALPAEPGATGRAWALAARWSATLPADAQWRVWRLRQGMDGRGLWHIGASQPDRHTPRLLTAGDTGAPAAAPVGECIAVHEPRRLRRLMGTQWTMTVLRVPVPLNDSAPEEVAH